jgi:cyclophilin family peptidyl-prolyl cis-trans isomerase
MYKKSFCLATISALVLSGCGGGSSQNIFSVNNPACQYESKMPADQLAQLLNYPNDLQMKIKPEAGDTIATLETNFGDMQMLLYTKEAPETAKNFIELAKAGKYDGTKFHRVIDCFMVQGGDFEKGNGTGGYSYKGPGTKLKDEFGKGLKNVRGAVSMANSGPNTGGSQFFIVQADEGTPWLDGKHAVFGFIFEGMGNVDKIAKVKVGYSDDPKEEVIVQKVTISEFK